MRYLLAIPELAGSARFHGNHARVSENLVGRGDDLQGARDAASEHSWVIMTIDTGSPGARPRWIMLSMDTPPSASRLAISASTPGTSSTSKRR